MNDSDTLVGAVLPHICRGMTCCVGLSGGGDSVALLHVLASLRRKHGFRLVALHMNHCLRGAESDADETFCRTLCRGARVPLRTMCVDVAAFAKAHTLSIEDAARRCRFEWFETEAAARGAASIFLAHHADDQAETLLLRLFRGAGLRGIAGMKSEAVFRSLAVVRPWLGIRRAAIVAYRAVHGLACCHDSSNDDTRFERNWVRKDLLPLITARFGEGVVERITATAALCRDVEDHIAWEAAETSGRNGCWSCLGVGFPLDTFAQLHVALQRAALRHVLDLLHKWERQHVEFGAIEALRAFALGTEPEFGRPLPRPFHVCKAYGRLFIGRTMPSPVASTAVTIGRATDIGNGLVLRIVRVARRGQGVSDNGEAWRAVALDERVAMVQYASLPKKAAFAVRSRTAGDRYRPVHGCSKKVKDLLIEAHVPQILKDAVPVVTADGEPVWLAGWRIADAFKARPGVALYKLCVVRAS